MSPLTPVFVVWSLLVMGWTVQAVSDTCLSVSQQQTPFPSAFLWPHGDHPPPLEQFAAGPVVPVVAVHKKHKVRSNINYSTTAISEL